ncbi:hypothetical protein RTO_26830 [[Ruminococcus] torques L2-14]|jgi:hypothetical protein|uniref:Uncharacterized protein n=1 Tax=[Ruminococcus] torques L2-14 TaxID=657313 RepID=D4LZD3_9FIRM|nr:hypothetical protein RTO_26830 [[Ruminococcus] torques L2-14]
MYEKKYNKSAKIREENEKCGWINRKKMLLYLLNSELSGLILNEEAVHVRRQNTEIN